MDFLDVSTLPTEAQYEKGGLKTNLAAIPYRMRGALDALVAGDLIKENESFGCAVAHPYDLNAAVLEQWAWDDPDDFIWFVTGWGPQRDKYIANAVRKLRPALREQVDTLSMRCQPDVYDDGESVESVDDEGRFPWGDFSWGGATFVQVGMMYLPTSVSCLAEVEDDAVAKLLGGTIGAEMLKIDYPEMFGPKS